jgi:DNA polymerase-1
MTYETLIIDAPYLTHRSFDAPYNLTRSDGTRVTLVHSFLQSFNALCKKFSPKNVLVAWESHGTPSWRRKLYPDYKPQIKVPESFIEQQDSIKKILYLLNVKQYYSPNNEADDVMAVLRDKFAKTYYLDTPHNVIFTVDKDIMQLANNNTHIWDGKNIFDANAVVEKFKVHPWHIANLLAITGDSSDNIPGLKGYGPVKASKLIQEIASVDKIPEGHPLYKHKQLLMRNKRLTTLNHKCTLTEIKYPKNKETIESILDKYELQSLKKKIPEYKMLGSTHSLEDFY